MGAGNDARVFLKKESVEVDMMEIPDVSGSGTMQVPQIHCRDAPISVFGCWPTNEVGAHRPVADAWSPVDAFSHGSW